MSRGVMLPPHSAHRWAVCPASVKLEADAKAAGVAYDVDSDASEEGKAVDWLCTRIFRNETFRADMKSPFPFPITHEMIDAALLFANTCRDIFGQDKDPATYCQRKEHYSLVHATECVGLPDAAGWGNSGLYVVDLKYGHRVVEPRYNEQLAIYASGFLTPDVPDYVPVHLVIVQPRAPHRAGPVRTWATDAQQVRRMCQEYARVGALAVNFARGKTVSCEAVPTPEGCRDCKARWRCEALEQKAYSLIEEARGYELRQLQPAEVGRQLIDLKRARQMLEVLEGAREAEVMAHLQASRPVPGWAVEHAAGRLAWRTEPDEVLALGKLSGVDLSTPPKPVTPTQARKIAKAAGLEEKFFDKFAERGPGGAKLVFDDGTTAAAIFGEKL